MDPRTLGRSLARAAGAPLALYVALCTGYLLALTFAAAARRTRSAQAPSDLPTFDIVIPAHNEASTLPTLLASINALDYPPERRRVHVVADNCTDGTAAIAHAAGARVYERVDDRHIGKGYALARGVAEALALPGKASDGIVMVDADSELSPNLLRAFAAALAAGAPALQAYYSVRNAGESNVAMLRYIALCLYHYVRPLGRAHLGLSVGLRGNGMCFRRTVADLGWATYGLAEDIEQHFRLLEQGIHVSFVPEAIVSAEMPVTLRASASQNARWERGRLEALAAVPRMLRLAVTRHDLSALDAAIEQMVAPLSVCLAGAVGAAGCGLAGRNRLLQAAGLWSVVGLCAYVLLGLRLAGAPAGVYRALGSAPRYALWKAAVWLHAGVRRPSSWVRTARPGQGGTVQENGRLSA